VEFTRLASRLCLLLLLLVALPLPLRSRKRRMLLEKQINHLHSNIITE